MLGKWLVFSLVNLIFIFAGGVTVQMNHAAAQTPQVKANAGPDQTVPGPSPVLVNFNGCASTGEITSSRWINQWREVRATDICDPQILVTFHKNAKPGDKRTFTYEIQDQAGHKSTDKVVITLGPANPSGAPSGDPAEGHTITGTDHTYLQWQCEVGWQDFTVGTLEDGRWYVRSQGVGEDCNWGSAATADCLEGTHWIRIEDGFTDKEGCVSSGPEDRNLVLTVGSGGWYVSDRNSGDDLVKLTPRNPNSRWIPEGSTPLP